MRRGTLGDLKRRPQTPEDRGLEHDGADTAALEQPLRKLLVAQ